MGRRIVEGDVFEVKISNDRKKLIQYIKKDERQLYSHIIRGFKEIFPLEDELSGVAIESLTTDFYAHTMIEVGQREFGWNKICRSEIEVDNDFVFYAYHRQIPQRPALWLVWNLNGEEKRIYAEKLPDIYNGLFEGSVLPPAWIMKKLETGLFGYKDFNPAGASLPKISL